VVNNPLRYKDEDGNTPLLLAIAGAVYGLGDQYFNDLQEISAGRQTNLSSLGEYTYSAGKGTVIALTGEASLPAASLVAFSGSLLQDAIFKPTISFTGAAIDALGTGNANPHAATSIGGVTHTYDNNGNLTAASPWSYTWNYRNNLTQSGNGTATTTYGYDHEGTRVLKTEGGVSTYFANRFYNTSTATTTKHIFAHGNPIATVTSGGGSASIALNATSTIIHGDFTSGPTTKNWTHTTSGSNRLLVLFADIWQDVGGTGTIT
jgi:hypothetical protein